MTGTGKIRVKKRESLQNISKQDALRAVMKEGEKSIGLAQIYTELVQIKECLHRNEMSLIRRGISMSSELETAERLLSSLQDKILRVMLV